MKKLQNLAGIIEYKKNVNVTEEDIDNIFITALNGGSNYWCPFVQSIGKGAETIGIGKHLNQNGVLRVWEEEEEGGGPDTYVKHDIGLNDLMKGIELYINGKYAYSNDIVYNDNGVLVLDCGMIDADVADAILQLSVFGDLIYG